jgi:DNA-binding phage protein
MRWLKPLFSAGESLVDRILCVLGAVFFAQAPEFMQQYLQRLGGHLAEARRQLAQFEEIARQAGKTVQELATQYAANADPAVVSVGKLVSDTELRVSALGSAEVALRDASVWGRPFVFLRQLDWEIARGTGSVYKPAVPTTIEGLLYALIGVTLILALYYGLIRPLTLRLFGASSAPKPEAKVA